MDPQTKETPHSGQKPDGASLADVVIFLTSTASLASGYINEDELRPALERHVKGEAVIVPRPRRSVQSTVSWQGSESGS